MSNTIHDSGYKKLFSNKAIFQQLIETFVKEPWVKDLDFSEFEALPKSFLSDHYKETESDLICKLKLKGEDFYFFVLLEFQSTVDKFMAVRMLNYITSFWLDLTVQKPQPEKLPPVFPVMLYNGKKKWTAPTKISELVYKNDLLGNFAVNFEYLTILENEYSFKDLLKIKNIVSSLFLAETNFNVDLLAKELDVVLKSENDKTAFNLFLNWFNQLFNHERITDENFNKIKEVFQNNEKAKSMLLESIRKQKQDWKKEGIQEGIQKGIQEGIRIERQKYREEKLQIARTMLQTGLSVEKVNLFTKLPIEEILKII